MEDLNSNQTTDSLSISETEIEQQNEEINKATETITEDDESNEKLLEKFVSNLQIINEKINEPNVYSNEIFAQTLNSISKGIKTIQMIEKSFEFNFHQTLLNIIKNTHEKFVKLATSDTEKLTKNDLFIVTLKCSMNIARSFSNNSSKFRIEFQTLDAIKLLFDFINNENLLDAYIKSSSNKKTLKYNVLHAIIRSSVGILLNLSRSCTNFRQKWNECDAVENLLRFAEKVFNISDNKISAYVTIANIAEDNQIDKLPNLSQIIPSLVKLIGSCAEKINSKAVLKRMAIQLDENSDEIKDICCVTYLGTIWHLVELIDSLYHMSINDKIKFEIYETHLMKDRLRTIVYKGNDTEIEYSLKLLHQLCFDERILQDVYQDKKFYKQIKSLKDNVFTTPNVHKQCEGILWIIDKKIKTNLVVEEKTIKQIMISYNRESRDLILDIKKELENFLKGFKIWIDVEDIHGSSLESMAKAIEQSEIVIIGMTEPYKMSTFCRAEAEYAFQLNKKIIPLILQPNYKPDGWLGIILGSKIFVNFTKYEFNECIRRLKEEINSFHNQSNAENGKGIEKQTKTPVNEKPKQNIKSNKVIEWSETQVEEWLKIKNINETIVNNVKPCSGVILYQLYEMMTEAPEFFYSSITSNKAIATRDVAVFTYELKSIFKTNL